MFVSARNLAEVQRLSVSCFSLCVCVCAAHVCFLSLHLSVRNSKIRGYGFCVTLTVFPLFPVFSCSHLDMNRAMRSCLTCTFFWFLFLLQQRRLFL